MKYLAYFLFKEKNNLLFSCIYIYTYLSHLYYFVQINKSLKKAKEFLKMIVYLFIFCLIEIEI